jgi:hypothetical protein
VLLTLRHQIENEPIQGRHVLSVVDRTVIHSPDRRSPRSAWLSARCPSPDGTSVPAPTPADPVRRQQSIRPDP